MPLSAKRHERPAIWRLFGTAAMCGLIGLALLSCGASGSSTESRVDTRAELRLALEDLPYATTIVHGISPKGYLLARIYSQAENVRVNVGVQAPVRGRCPAPPRVWGHRMERSHPIDASPRPIACVVSDALTLGGKDFEKVARLRVMATVNEAACLALGDSFSCFG